MRRLQRHCRQKRNSSILFLVVLIALSGCSYFNETRFENSLGRDVNLIDYSEDIAADLIEHAFPPLIPRQPNMSILTTTFVDNNNLNHTSHFGRLLQEHISAAFVQMGYSVKEVKLRNEFHIKEGSGELMLSRNLSLINNRQKAQAIMVGTISHAQRTMYISARLVNPADGAILSSQNYRLYMDKNVLAMFNLRVKEGEELIEAPSESLVNRIFY
ncbi:MAG: hypothetical protein D6B25_18740 [Desulfobulbaceae bacterium]|nr:MAG: hypothetical protein D6B25_18740 [Desulfobulbaceae bacterium]